MNADLIAQIRDLAASNHQISQNRLFETPADSGPDNALHINGDVEGPLILGDTPWFLRADFARDGADLQLTGEDGRVVIIENYFAQSHPPDLASASGAVLNAATAARLAGPLAPGQYAQAAPGPGADPIGRVETATGVVKATRADGTEVTLAQGDPVFLGDILETEPDSAVGITFADESTFSLGEDGRMTLDDMVYDPGGQTGSMQVNLLQGAFTFVSGQIAKTDPNAMVVTTPTSTIGIRGTAGGGTVDPLGGTTAALMPEANGFTGEMSIGNGAGFQIINQALQAVIITDINSLPSPPFLMTPQQLGQTFGSALSALPNAGLALPPGVISGANEGRAQQLEAQQAAQDAEAVQAEAEAEAEAAAAEADAAAAEAEAAAAAEAQATADAEAAAAAAEEAIAAAEELAAAAAEPDATPEEIAAAEEAALQAEEAQAIAEQGAQQAQEARTVAAQTQVQAAQAQAGLASANAQLAQATVAVSQAQAAVVQSSPLGAIASAALAAGLQNIPGAQQLNNAQAAVLEAQAQVQEAEAQALEAEAQAQQAEAQAQAIEAEIQAELAAASGGPAPGDAAGQGPTDPQLADGGTPEGEPLADGPTPGELSQALDPFATPDLGQPLIQPDLNQPLGDFFDPDAGFVFDIGQDPNFNDGPPPDPDEPVVVGFNEILDATTGDDNLFGGPGNTQFTMTQDVSLNGNDSIDGGGGTDELYLANLSAFEGLFDASDSSMEYSSSASGISGTISLTSIEQLYANDGQESDVRLNISGDSTGYGIIVAGSDGVDDTINVSDTSSLSEIGHTINDSDTLGTILFGLGGNDTITGSGRDDQIFGGDGNDTLTGGHGRDTLSGGAGNDVLYADGRDDINGGTGTDTLNLSDNGDDLLVENVETIIGGKGSDQIIFFDSLVVGTEIDLGGGVDTILLDDVTNIATLTDVETVYGGTGIDSITISDTSESRISFSGMETITGGAGDDFFAMLDALTVGSSIEGGGGTNTIKLSNGANTTTLNDVEYIQGGSAADTLTLTNASASSRIAGGGGADVIDLTGVSGGRQTIVIEDSADFGDAIDGFQAGAGNDVIDFNASLSRGASTSYKDSGDFESFTASALATVGTNSVVVVVSNSIAGYASATLVATALIAITPLTSGNTVLLATGNGTDTHLWSWQGTGSVITSADLTSVAELTGVDHTTLIADNFAGFTEHATTGTQGVGLTANGNDDIITGDGTAETVTLTGAAEIGDTYDGAGGTDTLVLDNFVNSISVANTEDITGGSTTDTVSLTTVMSGGTVDLAGGAQDRLILADGTNSLTLANTESVVGGTGTDSLILANANSQITTTDVETLTGGSGNDTITANGSVTDISGGSGSDTIRASGTIASITGDAGADIITVTGSNGTSIDGGTENDTITGGSGGDILTGGSGNDIFRYTSTSQAGVSLGEAITDFDANATDLIDISEIHLAGSFSYSGLVNDGNASAFLNGLILEFDTSGDGAVDMEIDMTGYTGTLDDTDFVTV